MENNRISPPIALKVHSRVGGYTRYIRSRFIIEKYGNPYQNPTARIKSHWELGSRVPPQFPGLPPPLHKLLPTPPHPTNHTSKP